MDTAADHEAQRRAIDDEEPARTPDGERVAFDPAHRPPSGDLSRTAKRFLLIVAIAVLLVLLWLLRDLLIMVLLAALIGSAMHGVVTPLETRMPRILAVLLAYVVLIAVVGFLGLVIVPPLVDQAAELAADLPVLVDNIRASAARLVDSVAGEGAGLRLFDRLIPRVAADAPPGQVLGLPFTVIQVIANTTVVVFLSALFILERDAIRRWTSRFLVARDRRPALELVNVAVAKLGAYVRGQLLVMAITGIGTATGMLLLGVPFALPMGLVGFFAEAIPLAGPIIAGVPVIALALLESPGTGLLMFIWLVVLQQLEGWLIYPMVQGRILSLSPIVVVLGVLAGATLYGVLGAVIAIPIVAVIDVVLREVVFPLRRQASRRDQRVARRNGAVDLDGGPG